MSAFIENILQKLLTPDSSTIKHATKQLLEFYVSEKCINGFFDIVKSSETSQFKVYSLILLRKKVKNWKLVKPDERQMLKTEIVEVLLKEPEETVKKQIVWLIASIYKYSVKSKQEWPELLNFVNGLIHSNNADEHLFGVYILSMLNEEAGEQMKPHYVHLFTLFQTILSTGSNLKALLYVLNALKHMIAFTDETELKELSTLLPLAMSASMKIIQSDQNDETVTGVFDFFQSIIEYDLPVMTPYVKPLTEMTLNFVADTSLKNTTRVCAMNFLNIIIEIQKTTLSKNDMIRPIVNTVFGLMCQSKDPLLTKTDDEMALLNGDADDHEEGGNTEEAENLFTAATNVLDYCALYFSAKKLIKILIEYVSPAFISENTLHRRAALAALAVTTEGCADYYRNHYLEVLTDICLKGMQDAEPSVVQVAYFALCEFSEYLQPNLTHFAGRIINLLIESIETKPELRQVSRLTVRFYDALQSFCEHLGDELEQHLPTLMSKLMTLEMQCNASLQLLRLIICTFSSIVRSVKTQFNPYFDFAVQIIKPHLAYTCASSKEPTLKALQIECIHLMASFAENVNKDKFNDSLIENCMSFVETTLVSDNDPEMRSASFELLSGLCHKLKDQLQLTTIMPQLIETLKSGEGISLVDSAGGKGAELFSAFDEIDLDEDLDDEEDEDLDEDDESDKEGESSNKGGESGGYAEDTQRMLIENEYVREKLFAIFCLQNITKFINPQLVEFYSDCFDELKNLSYLSHNDIKKESYLAMAYLISYYHDFCVTKAEQNLVSSADKEKILLNFKTNLREFHSRSVKAIKHDANRDFVMGVFDALRLLLGRCSLYIKSHLNEFSKSLEIYGGLIIDTFKNKIYCQTINQDSIQSAADNDDEEAEFDQVLKEFAGDVIPSLASCLPGAMFDPFFQKVLADLFRILHKSESSPAEKSFVIGVVGETVCNLDVVQPARAEQLFSEFYKYMFSSDDEIRSNTIFTIGVLCSQSNHALAQYYSQIVTDLYSVIKKEKNKQSMDNVCGTLCRLFVCITTCTKIQTTDLDLLIKTIFDLTPLRTDFNEYHTLFTFILQAASNKMLVPYYQKIIELCGMILSNTHEEFKTGTKEMIVQFLKFVDQSYKEELSILLSQMKLDLANAIKTHL